jgi:hypothetical protein
VNPQFWLSLEGDGPVVKFLMKNLPQRKLGWGPIQMDKSLGFKWEILPNSQNRLALFREPLAPQFIRIATRFGIRALLNEYGVPGTRVEYSVIQQCGKTTTEVVEASPLQSVVLD